MTGATLGSLELQCAAIATFLVISFLAKRELLSVFSTDVHDDYVELVF